MNTTNVNGRGRPTLSQQIERLDTILDGLADGLNEAVADAVRQTVGIAVQEAVRAALREALASPELRQRMGPPPLPPSPPPLEVDAAAPAPTQSFWQRFRSGTARAWMRARTLASWANGGACFLLASARAKVAGWMASAWLSVRTLSGRAWQARRETGIAAGAGAVAGLVGYLAGPMAAAVGCGLAVAALAGTCLWMAPVLHFVLQSEKAAD